MAQLPYLMDLQGRMLEKHLNIFFKKTSGEELTINRMNTKEIFLVNCPKRSR